METLFEYKTYLESLGYKEEYYQSFCGMLDSIDYYNDKKYHIIIKVYPTQEYLDYLDTLDEGTEYEPDYNKFIVISAIIECPICNVSGFQDGSKEGIILVKSTDQELGYYKDTLDIFEKCVWIQNHLSEHEVNILQAHINNLKRFNEEFIPVLNKYGYYQTYSSIFDCTEESGDSKGDSSPFLRFETNTHTIENECLFLSTDCISGELCFESEPFKGDDFDKYFVENILTDKQSGEIKDCFKYLFDKDYDVKSESEILIAFGLLRGYNEGYNKIEDLKRINLDLIPDKDYHNLRTKIQNIINSYD